MSGSSYRDEIPSGGGLDGLPGFHVKKGAYPHTTSFCSSDGHTTFRITPAFDNGNELPARINAEPSNFTPWIKAARMVKMMGVNNKFTCITQVKGRDPRQDGPIDEFAKAIIKAIEENARAFPQDWELWVKGKKGQGAKIPKPEVHAMCQGVLLEHGGKAITDAQRKPTARFPVILVMGKSARISLQNLCNDSVPGYNGNMEDWYQRFKAGDLISCNGGKLVRFDYHERRENVMPHYEISIGQHYPVPVDLAKQIFVPWDDLLEYLDEQQQINLLTSHFPPEPLDFALKGTGYYEMLPAHVKGAYDKMTQRTFSGFAGAPMGATPMMPAGYGGAPVAAAQPPVPAHWPAPAAGFQYVFNPATQQWSQAPIQAAPPPPPPPPMMGMPPPPPAVPGMAMPAAPAPMAPAATGLPALPGATPPPAVGAPAAPMYQAPAQIAPPPTQYAALPGVGIQQATVPNVVPPAPMVPGAPAPTGYAPMPPAPAAPAAPPAPDANAPWVTGVSAPLPPAPPAPAGQLPFVQMPPAAPAAPAQSPTLAGAGAAQFAVPPVPGGMPPAVAPTQPSGDPNAAAAASNDARARLAAARAAAEQSGGAR